MSGFLDPRWVARHMKRVPLKVIEAPQVLPDRHPPSGATRVTPDTWAEPVERPTDRKGGHQSPDVRPDDVAPPAGGRGARRPGDVWNADTAEVERG